MNKHIPVIILTIIAVLFTGCASTPQSRPYGGSNAVEKAIGGAVLGGIAGGVIGHQSGERDKGIAIGAATGAAGGYALGNEQDKRVVRSQSGGQRVIVKQPSGGGNRGITCRPPRPRGDVYGYERRSSYSRETYHGTNRPRYQPRYKDYVPAGAPPPRRRW